MKVKLTFDLPHGSYSTWLSFKAWKSETWLLGHALRQQTHTVWSVHSQLMMSSHSVIRSVSAALQDSCNRKSTDFELRLWGRSLQREGARCIDWWREHWLRNTGLSSARGVGVLMGKSICHSTGFVQTEMSPHEQMVPYKILLRVPWSPEICVYRLWWARGTSSVSNYSLIQSNTIT